jgi:UDP-N-acetylglucosamine--dolichyl-phosphate N-acetylglucosaminephosphotransferase
MKRRGIPRWLYFLLPLPAAIPLVAAKVGITTIAFPFFPEEIINLGNWYSLLLIPLALLCCSNATNFLAGFNGLEAGMGFILHYFLGIYAITHGNQNAGLLSLTFAASLLAFLKYNWYPAKVFPGDLSYTIGAVAVASAVIGDMEMYAAFCFLPWIIESILKLISGFKAESYGVLQENGTLKHEGKIRSLTHLVMLGNFTEEEVTGIFILSELIVCTIFYFAIG